MIIRPIVTDKDYPNVKDFLALLKQTPSFPLYRVVFSVTCDECWKRGAIQAAGQWYESLGHLSPAIGFGGTIPYRCPECQNVGLTASLEGYQDSFSPCMTHRNDDPRTLYRFREDELCPTCHKKGIVEPYGVYDFKTKTMTRCDPVTLCIHCQ